MKSVEITYIKYQTKKNDPSDQINTKLPKGQSSENDISEIPYFISILFGECPCTKSVYEYLEKIIMWTKFGMYNNGKRSRTRSRYDTVLYIATSIMYYTAFLRRSRPLPACMFTAEIRLEVTIPSLFPRTCDGMTRRKRNFTLWISYPIPIWCSVTRARLHLLYPTHEDAVQIGQS